MNVMRSNKVIIIDRTMVVIFENFLSSLRAALRDDAGWSTTGVTSAGACASRDFAEVLLERGLFGLLVSLVGFAKT